MICKLGKITSLFFYVKKRNIKSIQYWNFPENLKSLAFKERIGNYAHFTSNPSEVMGFCSYFLMGNFSYTGLLECWHNTYFQKVITFEPDKPQWSNRYQNEAYCMLFSAMYITKKTFSPPCDSFSQSPSHMSTVNKPFKKKERKKNSNKKTGTAILRGKLEEICVMGITIL